MPPRPAALLLAAALGWSPALSHAQTSDAPAEAAPIASAQAGQTDPAPAPPPQILAQKLGNIIRTVDIRQATARDAFAWWSESSGIPLVINWDALELEGLDPETPIDMQLQFVPVGQLLSILMRAASPEVELVSDTTPYYVQVMTKRQARTMLVTRVYDIADLLHEAPNFTDAPTMDLAETLSELAGEGGSQLFDDAEQEDDDDRPTRAQRGDTIADLIRTTLEPEIWAANGLGGASSVRHLRGRLIVRAPNYIHRQIGLPRVGRSRPPAAHPAAAPTGRPTGRPSDISSVRPEPERVGGVAER